jgi:hypothetical protein
MLRRARNISEVKKLKGLPQELIWNCTTWQTVSRIKIKYLEYEKAIQIFYFIDVTDYGVGHA